MAAKEKITVSLTDEAAEAVRRIAADRYITVSEVVRRGLALVDWTLQVEAEGGHVLVRESNGDLSKVAFVFAG